MKKRLVVAIFVLCLVSNFLVQQNAFCDESARRKAMLDDMRMDNLEKWFHLENTELTKAVRAVAWMSLHDCQFFEKSIKKMINYIEDFGPIMKHCSGLGETIATHLMYSSVSCRDDLYSLWDLLSILNSIHNERDKKLVSMIVVGSINGRFIPELESKIKYINETLILSQNQNLIILGNQFKRDLREINEKIKSIKFNIIKGGE